MKVVKTKMIMKCYNRQIGARKEGAFQQKKNSTFNND